MRGMTARLSRLDGERPLPTAERHARLERRLKGHVWSMPEAPVDGEVAPPDLPALGPEQEVRRVARRNFTSGRSQNRA
jgi:hypothetical protein